MILKELLQYGVQMGASDLHLLCGLSPSYRVLGRIQIENTFDAIDDKWLIQECRVLLGDSGFERFVIQKDVDISFCIEDLGCFRANFYFEKGNIASSIRILPAQIPDITSLEYHKILSELAMKGSGLILFAGSTGSGKSTSIASFVEHVNKNYNKHIVSIEDPIEFRFESKKSVISQRSIGVDSDSFCDALKYSLRQDPDIIVVGEIRDYESMKLALQAALTGHLVIATLHSNGCVQTIQRILSLFEPVEQESVRNGLSSALLGIFSQQLVLSSKINRRVMLSEVLVNNSAIANLIRENKLSQIMSQIQMSQSLNTMWAMSHSVEKAIKSGNINKEDVCL